MEIVKTTFEDYQSSEKFDCLIVLTAFHWIKEKMKYAKSAGLLKRNGRLVVGWNSFLQSASKVTREINSLYREMLPDIYPEQDGDVNVRVFAKLKKREREFFENDLFEVEFFRRYPTVCNYNKEIYPALLRTFPKIIQLEKSRRENFLQRAGEVIEKHGTIAVPVLTTLMIAGKKEGLCEKISRA